VKSKKGAVILHWAVFGLLAAIGLFAWLTYDAELGVKVKGEWQLDYLRNFYIEGQEELMQTEQQALLVGNKIIFSLADNGGFTESSPCGVEEGVHYWNKVGSFCFLEVDEEIDQAFDKAYQEKYNSDRRFAVSHQGKELVGEAAETEMISGPKMTYNYFPHFRANIGYNFDEYFQIQNDAKSVLDLCKWKPDLRECLEDTKPEYWKFTDCDAEMYRENERKVVFCSESPGRYTILQPDGSVVPVRYTFGLDFTTS